jgi:hypothetical protein
MAAIPTERSSWAILAGWLAAGRSKSGPRLRGEISAVPGMSVVLAALLEALATALVAEEER